MRHYATDWSSKLVFALTILPIFTVLGATSEAVAQSQPGESSSYSHQHADGNINLDTLSDLAEARGDGRLLHLWRGHLDNAVHIQFDGEHSYQTVEPTQTHLAPAVCQIGHGRFIGFHVGVDNQIYYAIIDPVDGPEDVIWSAVGFDATTDMPISVVQMGNDSGQVFLVWRGLTNTNIYSSWFDISTHEWALPQTVNHGEGGGPPSATYIPATNSISVQTEGVDNNLWYTQQRVGAQTWNSWGPLLDQTNRGDHHMVVPPMPGAQLNAVSNINTNGSQTIFMSMLDADRHPEYAAFDINFNQTTEWTVDATNWQTNETPNLSTNGNATYSLFAGMDDLAYYKQACGDNELVSRLARRMLDASAIKNLVSTKHRLTPI